MSADQLPDIFIAAARKTLSEGMHKLEHCAAQLSEEQFWWRPRPEMNSIANLMLHLSGNLRQWVIAGIGGAADTRNRPAEFSDDSRRPKAQIIERLRLTVNEADQVLAKLRADELISPRRIQGFGSSHDTVTRAISHTISHFRGHVQEIIHMTREQLGEKYTFDFIPKTQEQISAHGPAI
jgi:hypothetical protein